MSVPRQSVALLLVLCVAAVPAAAGGVAGASPAEGFAIESVSVSPSSPVPGERVTVSATLSAGYDRVTVDRVVLETEERPVDTVENLWTLQREDRSVSLSTRFESGGTHYVWVNVYGTTDGGETVHREEAVAVDVDGVRPNVAVTSPSPVADAESTLTLEVTNTLDVGMENLKLRLDGVEVRRGNAFAASVAPGGTATFDLTVVADDPGPRTVEGTLVFATEAEDRRVVRVPVQLDVRALEESVTLTTDAGGGTVTATVGNGGNRPLEGVSVVAVVDGTTVDRALVGSVPEGESTSVTLDVGDLPAGTNVTVRADYELGVRTGTVSDTVAAAAAPDGRIAVTGVSVVREGGRVRISGSASNVGLTQVNGTIVRVVDTASVTPAQPNRDFFVGAVPPSDFVSFDVYATVEGDVDAITLAVSYLVDGERVERTVEVPYEGGPGAGAGPATARPRGGGSDLLPVLGAVGAVLVVGAGAIVWRRRG